MSRWVACFSLVFGVHLSALFLLLHEKTQESTAAALADAVVLDMVAAPPITQPDKPQPPVSHSQNRATPPPRDTPEGITQKKEAPSQKEPPPLQQDQLSVESRQVHPKQKQSPAKQQTSSTSQREARTPKEQVKKQEESDSSPPAAALLSARANAFSNWKGLINARLEKYKHYPRMAHLRHQEGVAVIRIVISQTGDVLSVSLDQSSGFPSLDREALKLPKRAAPLPPPPQHMDDPSTVIMHINFEVI